MNIRIEKSKIERKNTSFFRSTELTLFIVVLALFVFLSLATNSFFTKYNLTNLLKQTSIVGIVSVAATLVIMSGGIDLSVGSIVGMGSLVSALLMSSLKMSIFWVVLLPLVVCSALGLFNGIMINELKLAPFITTLGSMIIIRGVIEVISGAKTIVGIYPQFSILSTNMFLGIPLLGWVWLFIVIIVALIIKYTRFGRNIFVIGNGEDVAKLSGINIRSNIYSIYMLSGLLSGIAGLLLTARINSAIPTGGAGYEMTSIAAAVIGGASLQGGEGSIVGTLLGTFLMVLINNGGIQLGIDPFVMDITSGVLIILAVTIDQLRRKKY
jgi:ribose transport system permease protein